MKMADDEIRKKAIAGMVRLEGLLTEKALLADNQLWLTIDAKDIHLINYRPINEHIVCQITREDCRRGLTSAKWQNCLISMIEFLRGYYAKEENQNDVL